LLLELVKCYFTKQEEQRRVVSETRSKPRKINLEDLQSEINRIKEEILQLKAVNEQLESQNAKLEGKNAKLED
jgi:septal ring factor EnvC (AmiA/AmiB activator)